LTLFEQIKLPDLVADELEGYNLNANELNITANVVICPIDHEQSLNIRQKLGQPLIHLTDAAVFILAQNANFSLPVLTDDLALRRQLEARDTLVIGSIGLLIRAYHQQLIDKTELKSAIDSLFNESSLHLSQAFRLYVQQLLNELNLNF
jgi:predicted nucleic acid-binding protein